LPLLVGGKFPVAGPEMPGHLFFEDLFQDGFDAFSDASCYISLHGLPALFLGQASFSSLNP